MLSTSVYPQQTPDAPSPVASQRRGHAVLRRLPNERAKTGGLSLEKLSVSSVGEHPGVWEKLSRSCTPT